MPRKKKTLKSVQPDRVILLDEQYDWNQDIPISWGEFYEYPTVCHRSLTYKYAWYFPIDHVTAYLVCNDNVEYAHGEMLLLKQVGTTARSEPIYEVLNPEIN